MIGDPKLREKSVDVSDFEETNQVLIDLKDTLEYLQKTKKICRALAAPQIGYQKKVIYMQIVL